MPEKLNTANCVDLIRKDIPPIQFVVDKLLAPGFYILAGLPKIGKSWLLLLLCIKVALGVPLWNYPTRQGRVLYLCLEDQEARIQERVKELTADGAPMLDFATKALTRSTGLLFQLEIFIQDYPDTKLIVIDTLPKVRDSDGDGKIYAAEYRDIGELKALADKYGVAIIAVQHLRKQYSPDPFQMVSGSSELCQRIHSKLKPNELPRRLNRYAGELQQLGGYIETNRTSSHRELVLTFSPSRVNDDMTVMTHS